MKRTLPYAVAVFLNGGKFTLQTVAEALVAIDRIHPKIRVASVSLTRHAFAIVVREDPNKADLESAKEIAQRVIDVALLHLDVGRHSTMILEAETSEALRIELLRSVPRYEDAVGDEAYVPSRAEELVARIAVLAYENDFNPSVVVENASFDRLMRGALRFRAHVRRSALNVDGTPGHHISQGFADIGAPMEQALERLLLDLPTANAKIEEEVVNSAKDLLRGAMNATVRNEQKWTEQLSVDLWYLVQRGGGTSGKMVLTSVEAKAFSHLQRNAKGWWRWLDGTGLVFLSTDDWLKFVASGSLEELK